MAYKALGICTGLAAVLFIGSVLLVSSDAIISRDSTAVFVVPAGMMAVGLLAMIWHLNVRQKSDAIKKQWRTYLVYLGPFAAAAYLFSVASQPSDHE